MGISVWLYMYLIDKITRIDDKGKGIVLGGKPIKFEEFHEETGVSQDTYTRWIKTLVKYPYIEITRTPYGIQFRVLKAFKRFRRSTEPDSAQMRNHLRTNAESNKTVSVDIINKTFSASRKNMKIRGYDESKSPDDVPSVDLDSGETRAPAPPRSKSESYKALVKWAEELRGFAFLPAGIPKQYKAFQMASEAKLSGADLKRRWIEMKDDKYWGVKGFDWMDVVTSFNKKGK